MIEAFVPPDVTRLVVGLKPISMRWGPSQIRSHLHDVLGVDPDPSTAFLFTNPKRDCLLLYCVDEDGDRVVQRKLDKGAFLLPVPDAAGTAYVSMKRSMLSRLIRS